MSSPTVTWVHNFRCDVILREDGRAIGRRCGFCLINAGLIQFKIRLPEYSDAVAHAKGSILSKHKPSLTVKLEADFLKPFFEEPTISLIDGSGLIPISIAGVPLGVQLPGFASLYLALEFNLIMLPISHDALSAIFLLGHVDPLHLDHSEASEQNKNSIGFHADDPTASLAVTAVRRHMKLAH